MKRFLLLKKATIVLCAFFMSLNFSNTAHAQNFAWAKSLGSGSNEEGSGVAVDATGNVYTTGYFTGSGDFDPGAGVTTLTSAGSTDVYISKLDALGNFVWALRLGGTGPQSGTDITLDNSGNVYMTGQTSSTNSAVMATPGCHQLLLGGMSDAFLVKFDANGVRLWSTYYGGTGIDEGFSCATDALGNIIVSGQTGSNSGTVIATSSCHQPTAAGNVGFFVKFNSI